MKKVLSILCMAAIMLFASQASAQISIQAGYLAQEHNVNFSALGQQLTQEKDAWMQGGFVGVSQNLPMFANLSLAPGVYLSFAQIQNITLINADTTSTAVITDSVASAQDISLKVPFFFNLKFGKFFVFGGPTFNVSLSTIKDMQTIANTISDPHFEMGGTIGAGVKFGAFRIYAGYNAGLIDRENFDYTSSESWTKAWEGSSFFAGLGVRL